MSSKKESSGSSAQTIYAFMQAGGMVDDRENGCRSN